MKFKNDAKPAPPNEWTKEHPNYYAFDHAPRLLFVWSGLFQNVISQCGTYLLTGKFHDRSPAIYKCEGGCQIVRVNELVLRSDRCNWDWDRTNSKTAAKQLRQMTNLINDVVLKWDPENPIDSMLDAASASAGCDRKELEAALHKSDHSGNPFSGNALSSFFDWNPFSKPPVDRDYLRFCLTKFSGKTDEEVNVQYADEDKGEELKALLDAHIKSNPRNGYASVHSCSPRRSKDGNKLAFWVNTGNSTQIDGWKDEEALRAFLQSDGLLVEPVLPKPLITNSSKR